MTWEHWRLKQPLTTIAADTFIKLFMSGKHLQPSLIFQGRIWHLCSKAQLSDEVKNTLAYFGRVSEIKKVLFVLGRNFGKHFQPSLILKGRFWHLWSKAQLSDEVKNTLAYFGRVSEIKKGFICSDQGSDKYFQPSLIFQGRFWCLWKQRVWIL
jgi:hypothetical protein